LLSLHYFCTVKYVHATNHFLLQICECAPIINVVQPLTTLT